VVQVFEHPVIQRCQLHKIRNVKDISRNGCGPESSPGCARPTMLTPRWPPKPSSRRSPASWTRPTPVPPRLREGLADTLTVLRLGVPPTLARTLRSSNGIQSMISICRDHAGNVKR